MTPYKEDITKSATNDDGVPAVSFMDFAEEVLRPQAKESPKRKKRTKRSVSPE
jgi:hypothetical protein